MSITPKDVWQRLPEEIKEQVIENVTLTIEEIIYENIGIDYTYSPKEKSYNIYPTIKPSSGHQQQRKS